MKYCNDGFRSYGSEVGYWCISSISDLDQLVKGLKLLGEGEAVSQHSAPYMSLALMVGLL